jgi:hypothetical protein
MYKYVIIYRFNPRNGKIEYLGGLEVDMNKYTSGYHQYLLVNKLGADEENTTEDYKYFFEISRQKEMLDMRKRIENALEIIFDIDDKIDNYHKFFEENLESLLKMYKKEVNHDSL